MSDRTAAAERAEKYDMQITRKCLTDTWCRQRALVDFILGANFRAKNLELLTNGRFGPRISDEDRRIRDDYMAQLESGIRQQMRATLGIDLIVEPEDKAND